MRPGLPILFACLLLGSGSDPLWAGLPASGRQLRFGVDVAKRGLWAEARFRFERAVLLDPRSAAAFNNLAVACEQQGDFEAAQRAYEEALRLKPGHRQIQQNYDLFREADEKRDREKKPGAAVPR
jgi:Tfp pilus assembly protein PilF